MKHCENMGLDLYHIVPSAKTDETLEYLTLDEFAERPDFTERFKHLITEVPDADNPFSGQTMPVIYWATKGYQRKGMNGYFYNDFENDRLYFDKATVIKASRYLSPPSIYGEQLKTHLQENFIDNFIEGESIFFAGW